MWLLQNKKRKRTGTKKGEKRCKSARASHLEIGRRPE